MMQYQWRKFSYPNSSDPTHPFLKLPPNPNYPNQITSNNKLLSPPNTYKYKGMCMCMYIINKIKKFCFSFVLIFNFICCKHSTFLLADPLLIFLWIYYCLSSHLMSILLLASVLFSIGTACCEIVLLIFFLNSMNLNHVLLNCLGYVSLSLSLFSDAQVLILILKLFLLLASANIPVLSLVSSNCCGSSYA